MLSVLVTLAPGLKADVRSQALYARALIPFNNAKWDEAYAAFSRAVEADRGDALAWYYRGLTQARQGNTAGAIQDMEQALVLNPSMPHVGLDLGIAYFSSGRHQDARKTLERAYQQGYERLTAAFFLGLTLYRLDDRPGALRYLNEAKNDPEVAAAASYYAGLVELESQPAAARADFEATTRALPASDVGQAAQQYLSTGAVAQPVAEGRSKRWSIYAGANVEYDSNVTIGPSDSDFITPRDISGKSDERIVVAAGGRYSFLSSATLRLTGSYDFSQSIHFDLTEFDLQGHRLGLSLASQWDRLSYGVAAGYNFFALNYQSFFQEGLGTPWLTFAESDAAATQLFYTIRARDFFRAPFDPGRDAINHAFGLRQYFSLGAPEQVLAVGYQYEIEDPVSNGPQGSSFAYHAHQLDAGIGLQVLENTHLQFAYVFRLQDYDNDNSGFGPSGLKQREDHEHQFLAGLVQPISDYVALTLSYIGIFNSSNVTELEYDRHIISAGVQVSF